MNLRSEFEQQTGFHLDSANSNFMIEYALWLEKKIRKPEPQLLTWIKTMFEHAEQRQWYETYWAFDIHGTISIPDYRKGIKKTPSEISQVIYYPFAKETLQLLTKTRPDVIKLIWSSSYPEELKSYIETFEKDEIIFKYANENPEITDAKGSFGFYDKKFYFNIMLEDKAGFNPETDWEPIYNYLLATPYRPNPKWSMKYKEEYHNK